MEASGSQSWFLSKHIDGSVFGPLPFEQVRRWAAAALVAPLAAGVAVSAGGAKWAFVATAITGFAVALWMLVPQPRPSYA